MAFARTSGAKRLALFHHDPLHDDATVGAILEDARSQAGGSLEVDSTRGAGTHLHAEIPLFRLQEDAASPSGGADYARPT